MSVKKIVAILPSSVSFLQPVARTDSPPEEALTGFLRLPHPRTRQPSLYLPYTPTPSTSSTEPASSLTNDGLLEVQKIQPPVDNQRCWFLTVPSSQDATIPPVDEVLSDGSLTILTPFDPLFLILALLAPLPPHFVDAEELWETAARLAIAGRDGGGVGGEKDEEDSDLEILREDIVRFGMMECVKKRLETVCEHKEHDSVKLYRYSSALALEQLKSKLSSISSPSSASNLFGNYESTELGSGKRKRDDEVEVPEAAPESEYPTVKRALGREGLGDGKGLSLELQRETREKMGLGVLSNYLTSGMDAELRKSYDFPHLSAHIALTTSSSSVLSSTYLPGRGGGGGGGGAGAAAAAAKKRKLDTKGSRGVEMLKKVNVKGMKTLGEMFKMVPKKKEEEVKKS